MFNRFFGRKPAPEDTPAPVYYEALFDQVMAGLAAGWSGEQVKACLAGRENDQRFVEWLFRYDRKVLRLKPEQRQQIAARLARWGQMDCGVVGQMVREMGQQDVQPELPKSEPELSVLDQQVEKLFVQGNDAYLQGDLFGAIAAYDQALTIKPDLHEALYNKGISLANLGRYEEAIATYDQALNLKPDYHEALNYKGVSLANLGRHNDAIAAYDQAFTIKPDKCQALSNKALSLANLGRHNDAIAAYDQALAINPNYHQALFNKGALLANLGRHEEAIAACDRALVIKPDYHEAHYNRGVALANLSRHNDAIAAYQQALILKPDYHEAINGKGVSLARSGQHEEAIAAYDQALIIKPDYHEAINGKGVSLARLGQHEEAIAAYGQALSIKPDDHQTLYNKGNSLARLGQHEEAIAVYGQALSIKPDDHQTFNDKGVSLTKLGQYEDAIIAYDHTLSIKPDMHGAWLNRGMASAQFHNQVASSQLFLNTSSLPLQHPELQKRGYLGQLACYQVGLQYILKANHPLGWGLLHRETGRAQYFHNRFNHIQLRQVIEEYNQALITLTAVAFPIEHLETLQDAIRAYLGLGDLDQVRTLRQQGLAVLQNLLNRASSSEQRRRIEARFSGFSHLQVDLLIADGLTTEALFAAERYKNRVLTWILDSWQAEGICPSITEMQTLLSPTTAAIYWHLSPDTLSTFLITNDDTNPVVATTRPSEAFTTWLKTWTRDYDEYRSKGKVNDQSVKENHPWRANLSQRLDELKIILNIDELANNLSNINNLILIPHRDLHRLPLHTFFPDTLTTYLPSTRIGLSLSQQPPTSALAPLLNIDDPDIEQPKMDYARLESALIRQLVGNTTHLAGRVTANNATQALETHYNTLHFTGHGEYNHRQPENSALQLTDELLTVKQIGALDLSSYGLVCLASCETALTGTDTIATEYVGLVSAFLKAGAANVLSTLWQVAEIESTWFIVRFYQALLEHQPPAAALKTAQHWLCTVTPKDLAIWINTLSQNPGLSDGTIDTLKAYAAVTLDDNADSLNQPLYTDPFFWAGFTLTGRG
ncbi:MAG: tetratricopeptide repeat protein [Cyanobacteria bacterium P01_A01_bin.15]